MAVILDYARATPTKSRLSWPRRIFPGLAVGVATTIAWIGGVGECVDGPLGNIVGWWVAPAIVLILFSAVYALCYKRSLVFEAFWSAGLLPDWSLWFRPSGYCINQSRWRGVVKTTSSRFAFRYIGKDKGDF